VSALGRGGFGINAYENFIQTDAAINQGNSGGAMVDTEGRLIGINTAILSRSGGNMGVGFAVPINMSRYVMDRIIKEGKVTRGYLGINIQPLTPGLAKAFGLPDDSTGVLVGGVAPQSPAEKAGLRKGDVILELDGKKVTEARTLSLQVSQASPGSKVNLRVLRTEPNGKPTEENLTATLGELPQETMASRGGSGTPHRGQRERSQTSTDALDGVEVIDISPAVGRQADVPSGLRGALVTKVAPDSNAYEAGLRPGDVILEINRQPVRNGDDAVKLSEQAKGTSLLLNVWSSGSAGGRQSNQGSQASQGGTRYIEVDNTKRK
jgi:serine protease Do